MASSAIEIHTYVPFPKQQEFHRCPAKYRLFGGAAGPGKSRALLEEASLQALEVPGAKTLLLRRTYVELDGSIISKFRSDILPQWMNVPGFRFNRSERMVYWPNGSTTKFGYCDSEDDVYQYQGDEFLFIGLDELTMFTYSQWKFLTSRNRCPIPGSYPSMAGASNPGNIGHDWVKRLFIERQPALEMDPEEARKYDPSDYAFIPARVVDNPIYANDANYIKTLESLPSALRKQFLDGDWSDVKGQYFSDFEYDISFLEHDDFLRMSGTQRWQPIWISIDWGSTHHAYASWHTFVTVPVDRQELPMPEPENTPEYRRRLILAELQSKNRGKISPTENIIVTFREYLISGLGEEALAEEIVRRTPEQERGRIWNVFLSPETGFQSELQRGYRIGSVFVQRNMPRARSAFDDRIDGWRLMHDKLRERVLSGGLLYSGWCITGKTSPDGKLAENVGCPRLLEAIPWAVCDPDHDGDIIAEGDSPLLDVLDGARYGIASYMKSEDKPASERKKEILAQMPVVGPGRFMEDKKFDLDQRKVQQPFYTGGLRSKPGRRHGRS